jgi:hypothetical protein
LVIRKIIAFDGMQKADAGSRLTLLEYAGRICLSGAIVVAVGASLHLPRFAGFSVEKTCEFLVKRTGVRVERFKFIFTFHRAVSFILGPFLNIKWAWEMSRKREKLRT